jgi:hypothetical protein
MARWAKNVLMLLQEEKDIDCMYSLEFFQNPHLIHTTSWVASVKVHNPEQISTKLASNVHWMVLYQICVFGADLKSNMAARAHNVFWLVEILKILWFQKKRWKCEIPIGSYVKLSRVIAAILNFRSANDSQFSFFSETTKQIWIKLGRNVHWMVIYKIFVFGADRKSNMLPGPIMCSDSPKTKFLYMTIQWTFLPSLIQICFVVSEKKMKMWNSHRVLC